MYLKSLTLRGFKSFASSTTLRLEPGITCVVGPNGSGKSNVVDAMAWVLGEQGAKALRGGTMSDVIFAGTPSRPPLGRAEVLLTIDNSDGALPIEYSEVTVGRLMFRSGQSEYTINGTSCRLLDIQELMSDSGIGRELHVIVGQGQLDAVLHASPEERRAFIEEAAGVLKHRKRKEKALRKLEAMAANLTRLTDLSAELRRQLGPLGRQAEIARKAGVIQATLRDARLRLLADDLVTARTELAADIADEETVRAKLAETEGAHAAAAEREQALEAELARIVPRAAAAQETWYALSSVRERLRGTGQLATERARLLRAGAQATRGGRDPEELEQEAAAVHEREAALQARLERDRDTLTEVVSRRAELEAALAAEEQALLTASRAAAARREGIARLAGKVETARSRAAAAESDIVRLTEALDAAQARDAEASGSREALDTELARIETERDELAGRHESAIALHTAATERLEALRTQERGADRDRASAAARRDALSLSLAPADGAAALLTATGDATDERGGGQARASSQTGGSEPGGTGGGRAGGGRAAGKGKQGRPAEPARVFEPPRTPIQIFGRLVNILAVTPGAEVAIAAALGPAADALAVGSVDDVVTALSWLRTAEAGRAAFVPAFPPPAPPAAGELADGLPAEAVPALELVRVVDQRFAPAVAAILGGVVVVDDLAGAARLAAARPGLRLVTRDGDTLGPPAAVGGSAHAPSLLELAAAAEEAAVAMATAEARAEASRTAMEPAREEVARTRAAIDAANADRSAAGARHRALTDQLAQLDRGRGSVAGEISRLERGRLAAEATRDQTYGALAELEAALAASDDELDVDERSAEERDRLVAATAAVRGEEVEARLAVRTSEERARGLAGRADALLRQAAQERAARAAAARTRALRERQAKIAAAVAAAADQALAACETSLAAAAAEREQAETARRATDTELAGVRDRVRAYAAALSALRDEAHRDELAREAKRLRSEALEAKALEEHGIAADDLVTEYGPALPVPPDEEGGKERPFDRAEQTARLATAEKQLVRLGKINPLALEEFEALQERAAFLSAQLDDIKNTRRDLLLVVEEVDSRVREVFAAAFQDTAREFEIVFDTLFPGGEGRLVLTDPEDMLTTGIEVEARPPGKKVKRLSLLSGGERSLTALAMLLAIFRARPSPFYVLDEVEAALDDRNLGRLLNAVEGLRQKSQLIIITHQKRTMEIADALYGVSMRGDGVTTVISQRLRERASA
ncbi:MULTISPECIES: chromosome segregation SMC family protein [unclassified Pseudofrankia]|uniref:chromosome segregation SMC family protein n=1 Tax=unclassified Pseudofrankia TaxID=2994372 RepID=UPI0008D905D8|nr:MULTISPECIES: AAA family ATPase [unclassified Pseudofrankia]MDT3443782.1 AAA family ATPase [Pseudofrankia sp. BMG5.37]OHV50003.1 chromosome segregation protein SMC [Pseudofrankia sp. BMG5.36]